MVQRSIFKQSQRIEASISDLMEVELKRYVCDVCYYVYDPALGDPENGVPAGTAFADLPDDWICPLCGVGKEAFAPE